MPELCKAMGVVMARIGGDGCLGVACVFLNGLDLSRRR